MIFLTPNQKAGHSSPEGFFPHGNFPFASLTARNFGEESVRTIMADSQSPTDIKRARSRRALGRRSAAMSRHEAETLQFLALVDSRRPGLAALLAFVRSPTFFLILAIGSALLFGGGQLPLASIAALMKSFQSL